MFKAELKSDPHDILEHKTQTEKATCPRQDSKLHLWEETRPPDSQSNISRARDSKRSVRLGARMISIWIWSQPLSTYSSLVLHSSATYLSLSLFLFLLKEDVKTPSLPKELGYYTWKHLRSMKYTHTGHRREQHLYLQRHSWIPHWECACDSHHCAQGCFPKLDSLDCSVKEKLTSCP